MDNLQQNDLNNRLEKWQKKLLDLSLKNPLLSMKNNMGLNPWYPNSSTIAKWLEEEDDISIIPLPISEEGGLKEAFEKTYPIFYKKIKNKKSKNINQELKIVDGKIVDLKNGGSENQFSIETLFENDKKFVNLSESHIDRNKQRLDYSSANEYDLYLLENFVNFLITEGVIEEEENKKENKKQKIVIVDASDKVFSEQLSRMEKTNKIRSGESGVHVLFMALGFVHWNEGKSIRTAPLILIPVELSREHLTDPYVLVRHHDDRVLNPVLIQTLYQKFGIDFSSIEEELSKDNCNVDNILEKADVLINKIGTVKKDSKLSLFSFAKHHMWKDLEKRIDSLEKNNVVQKIVGIKSTNPQIFPPLHKEELDNLYAPDMLMLPLPADSSQIQAIAKVLQGESLIIQGPPGTGKSQTITNLIVNLIANEKRVLFVAEKLTALGVVHDRLQQLNLDPFCLELHTQSSSKKYVLKQLDDAINVKNIPAVYGYKEASLKLQKLKTDLNNSLNEMHKEYPNGYSVYRAISRLTQLKEYKTISNLIFSDCLIENEETVLKRKQSAIKYAQALKLKNNESEIFDVWRGLNIDDEKYIWENLHNIINKINSLKLIIKQNAALNDNFELNNENGLHSNNLGKLICFLELIKFWKEAPLNNQDIPREWKTSFIKNNLSYLHNDFKSCEKEWINIWSEYNKYFKKSSLNNKDIWEEFFNINSQWSLIKKINLNKWNKKALIYFNQVPSEELILKFFINFDEIKKIQELTDNSLRKLFKSCPENSKWDFKNSNASQKLNYINLANDWFENINSIIREEFLNSDLLEQLIEKASNRDEYLCPKSWSDEKFNDIYISVNDLLKTFENLDEFLKPIFNENIYSWEDVEIKNLENVVLKLIEKQSFWNSWRTCEKYRIEAINYKLIPIIDGIENKLFNNEDIENILETNYLRFFVNTARMEHPEWISLQGSQREHIIEQFKLESDKFDQLTQKYVVGKLAERLREKLNAPSDELNLIVREKNKKTNHLPTRKLIRRLPKLLPILKPCLMMSPVSVAEYLSNDVEDFDVVIFDEASQITTADAIGAISRAKQIVVVGDPKQMPPTRMFSMDEDEDSEDSDLDSILTECLASGMKSVLLNWHYRSRNEHLINFSNKNYYNGQLITFPSAYIQRNDRGLVVHDVNGVYDRGGSGTNPEEARAVVEALKNHLLKTDCSQSLGVVTFNQKQQNLIETLWEKELIKDKNLQVCLEKLPQSLTIKNLESVQGDERDIIYFSTTFGKDMDGKFLLNFGPLGQLGGERRLNVAITRARDKMEIFCSFHPNEIDLSRVTNQGVRDLRSWLMYARGIKNSIDVSQSQGMPDSPFEIDILNGLSKRGWTLHPQIGCSGYRIDIAVVNPENKNQYLSAIECDGATYHSFKAARDRDKQRQIVLENLGWKIIRIWSTDFFEDPERELDRVDVLLKKLLKNKEP